MSLTASSDNAQCITLCYPLIFFPISVAVIIITVIVLTLRPSFLLNFFFFKQKTAYEIMPSLVGSEMCIRDSHGSTGEGYTCVDKEVYKRRRKRSKTRCYSMECLRVNM